jgi:FlaA1/EpsC-like NDP-sugar epimerase
MYLNGKTILITGGAGTVGRELIRQIMELGPAQVRVVDNNETAVFFLEEDYAGSVRDFHATIGDVRDFDKLRRTMDGVDVVFHCAALKHVILCEKSPHDAVQTNVNGVKNVIDAALENDVERVVFTSSDKAVNPTNVMGTSKLMGERLITAANSLKRARRTIFSSTRFGNVIGSRGSVFSVFYQQIRDGKPLTLTDPHMTRFIMTAEEAARLVIEGGGLARGGEVFVTKMPIIRIEDLAHAMIGLLSERFGRSASDCELRVVGAKAGEKLYEELMSDEETRRAVELPRMFAVLPAFRSVYGAIDYDYPERVASGVNEPYVSNRYAPMSRAALREYIVEHRLIEQLEQATLR